jgi:sulfur-carrier protein adenylyltransferase/sulfurtransferase
VEPYAEISPSDLKRQLDAGRRPALLDVREPWEREVAAIAGSQLIPMDQLQWRVDELPSDGEVVVYCHHGVRAAAVVQWLRRQDIAAVNLRGGIDAWALEVDPALRRY